MIGAASRLALVGVALAGAARGALADDLELRRRAMTFGERAAELVVTTSFAELFDEGALAAVASGLPTTVALRIYVYRGDDRQPVSLAVVQLDIVYDLWDDVYVVRVTSAAGSRTTRHQGRARAVEAITRIRELPIAPLARIAIGAPHFAALVAELNPVSDHLQAEMRQWLSRGAGDRLAASSSFFGSFVSVFVNPRLAGADRVVRLRSQPFQRLAR